MALSTRLQQRLDRELSPSTASTTEEALSPTAQRLTETFGRLSLPPTLRTMLVIMERRLRGKPDSEVRESLLMLGHALIAVAGGQVAVLELPPVVDEKDEDPELHATVTDIAALHGG